jgi:hypothetical protein
MSEIARIAPGGGYYVSYRCPSLTPQACQGEERGILVSL